MRYQLLPYDKVQKNLNGVVKLNDKIFLALLRAVEGASGKRNKHVNADLRSVEIPWEIAERLQVIPGNGVGITFNKNPIIIGVKKPVIAG